MGSIQLFRCSRFISFYCVPHAGRNHVDNAFDAQCGGCQSFCVRTKSLQTAMA